MKAFITSNSLKDFFKDGMRVLVGGFLANGTPEILIDALLASGVKDLTIICNDGGFPDRGVGKLIANNQVKKLIASHIGTNPLIPGLIQAKELEVELVPQGTLVERIRAYAGGLGGILTPTGLRTMVEKDKKQIEVGGVTYLLEEPLGGDLALIGGATCDQYGNVKYRKTMRNFNPIMAMAAPLTICQAKKTDFIDPDDVVTHHALLDYIVVEEE
ncbi:MAG: 3-oxoacid CoA-transferase subunit A [Bacilli bacterium]|jgi:acetate CoA/acetoacetate CoA-transferase alpha subunit|nr:3-oxoacid CoA-transferase subunit A [Bacilli bacterium]